ncbi:MAG: hypothetical protein OXN97_09475 [Bryobacterales bacterium]|nr:hypothetical protein [Bryobacterales bacterium]MDE0625785.1 hypothetical protein [Bryobacterales bacterium]
MRRMFPSRLFLALAACLLSVAAIAQLGPEADGRIAVEIPDGVPLSVAAAEFGNSDFEARGGAMVIELSGLIRFRHEGGGAVRAVTLAVRAHEQMMGGRAAVSVPSLHAPRGEEFQVRLNLRMLRPLPAPPGPLVRISPDAVLFASLAAAGPDRLDSVRKMRVREMEARRDRSYFLAQWRAGGRSGLASAMQASLRRQAARPRLDVRPGTTGPAVAAPAGSPREVRFAFLQDGSVPVILERGTAMVRGTVSDAPRILLRNRSGRGIRRIDVGWLVHDSAGRAYSVGSAPMEDAPGLGTGESLETSASGRFDIRAAQAGENLEIAGMSAYVRSVQMEDASVWVPSRDALQASRLLDAVPVSAEEQRLSQMYRHRGPAAVVDELRKLVGDVPQAAARR